MRGGEKSYASTINFVDTEMNILWPIMRGGDISDASTIDFVDTEINTL